MRTEVRLGITLSIATIGELKSTVFGWIKTFKPIKDKIIEFERANTSEYLETLIDSGNEEVNKYALKLLSTRNFDFSDVDIKLIFGISSRFVRLLDFFSSFEENIEILLANKERQFFQSVDAYLIFFQVHQDFEKMPLFFLNDF